MAKTKKLKKLKSFRRKPKALEFDFESLKAQEQVVDSRVREIARRFTDFPDAERVAAGAIEITKREQDATIPEAIAYYYLENRDVVFYYQSSHMGGRAVLGGLVPDFVVASGGGSGYVWLIQGNYWHGQNEVVQHDLRALRALNNVTISGVEILDVVEIWEDDIYMFYPSVFDLAMDGIGLRESRIA